MTCKPRIWKHSIRTQCFACKLRYGFSTRPCSLCLVNLWLKRSSIKENHETPFLDEIQINYNIRKSHGRKDKDPTWYECHPSWCIKHVKFLLQLLNICVFHFWSGLSAHTPCYKATTVAFQRVSSYFHLAKMHFVEININRLKWLKLFL